MIVRALDEVGDWTFGKGKSDYLTGANAIAQSTQTRLKSFRGDCFFDLDAGIDWWNLLGSKNIRGLILAIKTTIMGTRGVTKLVELSQELDENRALGISYSITTVFSTEETLTRSVEVP